MKCFSLMRAAALLMMLGAGSAQAHNRGTSVALPIGADLGADEVIA